jgi:NADH:ubiquinone oxidoreductase subunit E
MKQPLVITVCVGSSCHLRGAPELIRQCAELIASHKLEHRVVLKGSFCIGHCGEGVSLRIGKGKVMSVAVKDGVRLVSEKILPLSGEG